MQAHQQQLLLSMLQPPQFLQFVLRELLFPFLRSWRGSVELQLALELPVIETNAHDQEQGDARMIPKASFHRFDRLIIEISADNMAILPNKQGSSKRKNSASELTRVPS